LTFDPITTFPPPASVFRASDGPTLSVFFDIGFERDDSVGELVEQIV
jgi:hypothetical protein